jgi:hypothetical protein
LGQKAFTVFFSGMNLDETASLVSVGHQLDTSGHAFGELRDSSYLTGDGEALRTRMEEDGYVFMRGFFKRAEVMAARAVMVERLAAKGVLEPGTDPMDAIIKRGNNIDFRPDLAVENAPLRRLLYSGPMMEFYREFFGEAVRHYDFTWLRADGVG